MSAQYHALTRSRTLKLSVQVSCQHPLSVKCGHGVYLQVPAFAGAHEYREWWRTAALMVLDAEEDWRYVSCVSCVQGSLLLLSCWSRVRLAPSINRFGAGEGFICDIFLAKQRTTHRNPSFGHASEGHDIAFWGGANICENQKLPLLTVVATSVETLYIISRKRFVEGFQSETRLPPQC